MMEPVFVQMGDVGTALSTSNLLFFGFVWMSIIIPSMWRGQIEMGLVVAFVVTAYSIGQGDVSVLDVLMWTIVVSTSGFAAFVAVGEILSGGGSNSEPSGD